MERIKRIREKDCFFYTLRLYVHIYFWILSTFHWFQWRPRTTALNWTNSWIYFFIQLSILVNRERINTRTKCLSLFLVQRIFFLIKKKKSFSMPVLRHCACITHSLADSYTHVLRTYRDQTLKIRFIYIKCQIKQWIICKDVK